MLVDKKNNELLSGNKNSAVAKDPDSPQEVIVPEQVASNGPIDVLRSIMKILKNTTWEYGVPNSPKIFRTVQVDDGQYERIISSKGNMEETLGFPAAFVHFIGWNYLVQQSRVNDGRAELRIRFILNNLDVHESGHDMDVYYVAERINQSIQESAGNYECLQERCRLSYIDPMESFDRSLQPCWMTYEVWFKQRNIWMNRRKIYKKIVCPPFTNHSDQNPDLENANPHNHTDLDHPEKYDDVTKFTN